MTILSLSIICNILRTFLLFIILIPIYVFTRNGLSLRFKICTAISFVAWIIFGVAFIQYTLDGDWGVEFIFIILAFNTYLVSRIQPVLKYNLFLTVPFFVSIWILYMNTIYSDVKFHFLGYGIS